MRKDEYEDADGNIRREKDPLKRAEKEIKERDKEFIRV